MNHKRYLYRVECTNKKKVRQKHLVTVNHQSDEDARRKIIHKIFSDGGQVHTITPSEDNQRLPGEGRKINI